jgi:hypothetical protein
VPPVVLLGPQRLRPRLADAVRRAGVDGPVAVVTAGWQEREDEVDELREHLGRRVQNLQLYRRAEQVFAEDGDLFRAYRLRQDRLRRLQAVYRLRLGHALEAARGLLRWRGERAVVGPHRTSAFAAVRALDRHHLGQIRRVHQHFEAEHRPLERPALARHRREIAELISGCAAFAVAGGHVGVLLNRLRLFEVVPLAGDRPVFAWSGGAMALGERLVLFHDTPPQGQGDAEVLESGLALFSGVLPLPHARRRLRLEDPVRVALLAHRFGNLLCAAMDEGAELTWDGERWRPVASVRQLLRDGTVAELVA